MTSRERYVNLPLSTILITNNGIKWIKITPNEWRCISGNGNVSSWSTGDIYTDHGDEEIDDKDIYISPFNSYLNEIENGSI